MKAADEVFVEERDFSVENDGVGAELGDRGGELAEAAGVVDGVTVDEPHSIAGFVCEQPPAVDFRLVDPAVAMEWRTGQRWGIGTREQGTTNTASLVSRRCAGLTADEVGGQNVGELGRDFGSRFASSRKRPGGCPWGLGGGRFGCAWLRGLSRSATLCRVMALKFLWIRGCQPTNPLPSTRRHREAQVRPSGAAPRVYPARRRL